MSDDELEEAFQNFATPQAKLMREAAALIAAGDPEIIAARAACTAAMRHYRSLDGVYQAVKGIRDVSWAELHAAAMEELVAHMATEAAMYKMLAVVARRRRLELQEQQREGGQGST